MTRTTDFITCFIPYLVNGPSYQAANNSIDTNYQQTASTSTIYHHQNKTTNHHHNHQTINQRSTNNQQPTANCNNERTNERTLRQRNRHSEHSQRHPPPLSLPHTQSASPNFGYPTSFRGLTSGPVRPICVRCINVRSIPHSL